MPLSYQDPLSVLAVQTGDVMAGTPEVALAADTGPAPPPPSALENWIGALLHSFNPWGIFSGGPPASLPVPKSMGGTGADEPARTGVPSPQTAPPAPPLGPVSSGVLGDLSASLGKSIGTTAAAAEAGLSVAGVYLFLGVLGLLGVWGLLSSRR